MTAVLHLVTDVTSTSIPLEIAERIHTGTDVDTRVAAFYHTSPDDVDPDVAEFGVPVTDLGGDSRFDLGAYRTLRRLLDEVDVLHTHQNFVGSAARAVAATTDTAVVDTEHNDHHYFSHLQNLVNAPTLPLADCVVTNSRATLDSFRWYERPFVRGVDTRVVYNGVDLARIDAQAPADEFDGDAPLIVTVGALIDQKNQSVLVRAMRSVVERFPAARLVIVGDGPLRTELERTAVDAGVAENVTFAGYLPTREEVYRVMKTATVFAMSSDYEGFCVAAVEAMACGVPVVASDLAVFREVLGASGTFADRGSPEAFAGAIIGLLEGPNDRRRLGERARRRAETQFPLRKTATAYRDLYLELTDGAG
jgi:glycosyltransferase involved in cell wall biosynthesis